VAKKQFYTVSEAAAAKKVTRGAIHEAIKKRPLARRMDHDRASGGLTLKAAKILGGYHKRLPFYKTEQLV
jgi:hypothetical protein